MSRATRAQPRRRRAGQPLWHGRFGEGPGRRAARVHGQPAVRPAPRGRRPRAARARTCTCSNGSACSTSRSAQVIDRRARPRRGGARDGTFAFAPTDEDIHTAIERRVTEIAGATGAKLHTGRSRNDQVALDLRLYLRREGRAQIAAHPRAADGAAAAAPRRRPTIYLPGYTHLQRAQPVLLAHHLLAHFWALARDVDRWRDCLDARRRVAARRGRARRFEPAARSRARSPTSSASRDPFENSLDAVSDRDFVAEALFVADAHAGAPVAPRRGDRAVVDRGVRLPAPRRRVLDRFVDAAAEEEPRHRRARPRQGGPADRRPHRLPRDAQGRCRSRTTATCRRTRSRCSTRSTRARCRCSRSPGCSRRPSSSTTRDDRRRRQPDERGDRPRRAPRASRARRSAKRTRSSARSCGSRSSGACRSTSWCRTIRASVPSASSLLEPGSAVRRRTTPGGGGPEPVARQLEPRARERLDRAAGVARDR